MAFYVEVLIGWARNAIEQIEIPDIRLHPGIIWYLTRESYSDVTGEFQTDIDKTIIGRILSFWGLLYAR